MINPDQHKTLDVQQASECRLLIYQLKQEVIFVRSAHSTVFVRFTIEMTMMIAVILHEYTDTDGLSVRKRAAVVHFISIFPTNKLTLTCPIFGSRLTDPNASKRNKMSPFRETIEMKLKNVTDCVT